MRGPERGGGYRPNGDGCEGVIKALGGQQRLDLFAPGGETINPRLLDAEAQETARRLKSLAPSQLRRFYGQVVAFRTRLETNPDISDAEVQAQVAAMKANAAYAGVRDQPVALVDLFVAASNSVRTGKEFLAFARHMQAVVAFHKVYGIKKEGAR